MAISPVSFIFELRSNRPSFDRLYRKTKKYLKFNIDNKIIKIIVLQYASFTLSRRISKEIHAPRQFSRKLKNKLVKKFLTIC